MIRQQPKTPLEVADPGIYEREDTHPVDLQEQLLEARQMRDRKEKRGRGFKDAGEAFMEHKGNRIGAAWEHFRGRAHIDLAKLVSDEDAKIVSLELRRRNFEANALAAIDLIQSKAEKIRMQQELHKELEKMKEVEKDAQAKKREVELRFNKRKAEVEALERELNSICDEKISAIEVEEGYVVNKERQKKMVEAIASIKKDLAEHIKIVDDLEAIEEQLEQGISSRGRIMRTIFRRDFREKDFDAALKEIPVPEGRQLKPDVKRARENAIKTLKEYREVDGMSLGNIFEQNNRLLVENTEEIKILKWKLENIIKAKVKIDAVCIRAEGRIGKIEQCRRSLDLKKSESKDQVKIEPYKNESELNAGRGTLKLIEKIKDADDFLNKTENFFDKATIEKSKDKGIDSVKDSVKKAFVKRNDSVNEIIFNLEESNRRIEKTLEGKGLKDSFKTKLKERKKNQIDIIAKLQEKIVDVEDWGSLKKKALDIFPELIQTNKTESSIEDPVGRFKQLLEFIQFQKEALDSARDVKEQESINRNISMLCLNAARAIGEMILSEQVPIITSFFDKIESLGIKINEAEICRVITDGIYEAINKENLDLEQRIILLADTGVELSKGKNNTLIAHHVFNRAYMEARELIRNDADGISPKINTLFKVIYDKALEAGLNPDIAQLEREKQDAVRANDIDAVISNMEKMFADQNDASAVEAFNLFMENNTDKQKLFEFSCKVLKAFQNDGQSGSTNSLIQIRELAMKTLRETVESSKDDLYLMTETARSVSEVIVLYKAGSNNDAYIPELVNLVETAYLTSANILGERGGLNPLKDLIKSLLNNHVFEAGKREEIVFKLLNVGLRIAGNKNNELSELAVFACENIKSERGQNFTIDAYVKIAENTSGSNDIIEVAKEMTRNFMPFNNYEDTPYLKTAVLRIFKNAEREISNGDKKVEKSINLYFTMYTYRVINSAETLDKFRALLAGPDNKKSELNPKENNTEKLAEIENEKDRI